MEKLKKVIKKDDRWYIGQMKNFTSNFGGSKIMGMSASQLRYCLISGKKSDVEFEGQQINQQRTTLATETSTYNSQLLDLKVPTAPSADSYTKTNYTFDMGGNNYSIKGVTYVPANGTYTINTTNTMVGAEAQTGMALFSGTAPNYTTGSSPTTQTNLSLIDVAATGTDAETDATNMRLIFGNNYATALDTQGPDSGTVETYYKYSSNGTIRYVKGSDIEQYVNTNTQAPYYFVNESASIPQSSTFTNTTVAWDSSGRMTSFTDSNNVVHQLTASTKTDEAAYNDAMNQYAYDKQVYEQANNQINAKISVVELQDKKLELKLQNLDTQQQALSTEMESVKKVIDKNIEASFKAFA